jgi:phosphonate transport system ATP-binding protein
MSKSNQSPESSGKLSNHANSSVYDLNEVTKEYGDLSALSGLTWTIQPGERVALIGPSGAGKTTLINILNGSLRPTRGSLRILGKDQFDLSSSDLRRLQRRIGTVYQQFHLVRNLRVIHNVNAGQLGRWPLSKAAISLIRPQNVASALHALERVGIPDKLHERTSALSGGQVQRVAIARVLLQNPDVILADEPIASLDPRNSRAIMDLLSELCVEMGKTLVVSLHSVEFAFSHCQRVIGLRSGQVIFDASSDSVTQAMIDALYRFEEDA